MRIRILFAGSVKVRILLFLAFFSPVGALCQEIGITDSIRKAFDKKPVFSARLNTRNSFISGLPIATRGVKVGFNYGEQVSVGVGYHWITPNIDRVEVDEPGRQLWSELRMWYVSAYMEYSFIYHGNLQVIIPVQIGAGMSRARYHDNGTYQRFDDEGLVVLYEPGMVAEYSFLRYFAAGGGVGIRLMLINNRSLGEQFTAPIWEVRFKVKFGQLYNDLLKKE
ncbi:MAG: hypothetical protein RL226_2130 [Bacteroidota bacterium]|jgi:hypothetical protein